MKKMIFFFSILSFVFCLKAFASTITLSGSGSSATNYFYLGEGFYEFSISFSTTSNNEYCRFKLIDQYGNTVSNLGSESIDHPGTYTFEQPVNLTYDGNFIITVDTYTNTDGNWEILITSVSEIERINLYGSGYYFSGTGSSCTKLFYLKEGLFIIKPTVHLLGIDLFSIHIYDEYGNSADYLYGSISADNANVPFNAEYSLPCVVPADGYYLLAIDTYSTYKGDWEIAILSPRKMSIGGIPGDFDGDGKIGLPEAINALQIIGGMRTPIE